MYKPNRIVRVVNILFWIHFSVIVYYVILIKLIFITSDPDPYFTFSITLIHVTQLINHHILCFKIKHLKNTQDLLFKEFNHKNIQYLRKRCFIMLAVYLSISSVSAYLYTHFIIPNDDMILIINNFYSFQQTSELTTINHIFVHYLMTFYFSFLRNSWLMVSTFIYIHYLDCFNFYHENILRRVLHQIKHGGLNHKIFRSFFRRKKRWQTSL